MDYASNHQSFGSKQTSQKRAAAIGLLLIAALAIQLLLAGSAAADRGFQRMKLPIQRGNLFDMGVTDYNGDGALDLFSTAHKFRGSLLANDGSGAFSDQYYATGNGQVPDLPGFNDLLRSPAIGTKGLYLWVDEERQINLRTVGLGTHLALPQSSVSGVLRFAGREADVVRRQGASVTRERDDSSSPPGGVIRFTMGSDANLVLHSRFMDLPFEVEIEPSFRTSRILAGPDLAHPPGSDFTINLGDRHGLAWADLDGDGDLDAYAAVGGLRGAIGRFESLTHDEVLRFDGSHYRDVSSQVGLGKGICRGREASIVDYNGDGLLDIFSGCEELHPVLLPQRVDGSFGSRTELLTAAGVDAYKYRWLDLIGGPDLELLAIGSRRAKIYRQTGDGFKRTATIKTLNRNRRVDAIALGDADGNGFTDAFIASPSGNTLLMRRGARLKPVDPARYRLPKRSLAANWVDVDNDGRAELHLLPQGLYEAKGKRRFRSTGLLRGYSRAKWATASWVDLDNDGYRDLVQAEKMEGVSRVRAHAWRNKRDSERWLEVELRGPRGNAQAIGANVILSSGKLAWRQEVGDAEGSRWGQGHYRLYFGLGLREADRLTVRWPDGTRTTVADPGRGRVLTVSHPDA